MTLLTPHFTLEELTRTDTKFDNTPPNALVPTILVLAKHLEVVRAIIKAPMTVDSAYRSTEVNNAVGGVPTSAHHLGFACDFTAPNFGSPFAIAKVLEAAMLNHKLDFDQLIYEITWVHISFDLRMRKQCFTHPPSGGYIEGIQYA